MNNQHYNKPKINSLRPKSEIKTKIDEIQNKIRTISLLKSSPLIFLLVLIIVLLPPLLFIKLILPDRIILVVPFILFLIAIIPIVLYERHRINNAKLKGQYMIKTLNNVLHHYDQPDFDDYIYTNLDFLIVESAKQNKYFPIHRKRYIYNKAKERALAWVASPGSTIAKVKTQQLGSKLIIAFLAIIIFCAILFLSPRPEVETGCEYLAGRAFGYVFNVNEEMMASAGCFANASLMTGGANKEDYEWLLYVAGRLEMSIKYLPSNCSYECYINPDKPDPDGISFFMDESGEIRSKLNCNAIKYKQGGRSWDLHSKNKSDKSFLLILISYLFIAILICYIIKRIRR